MRKYVPDSGNVYFSVCLIAKKVKKELNKTSQLDENSNKAPLHKKDNNSVIFCVILSSLNFVNYELAK